MDIKQEGKVAHRTDVEKNKPALAGKLNLMDESLVQMAQSITIFTQCYRIDSLINSSGMMFWGGGGNGVCGHYNCFMA